MRLIASILFQLVANILAIQAADYFIPGVDFSGNFLALLRTGAIITGLNVFVKPLATLFLKPFIILSLGILGLVLNAVLLWLTTYWAPELAIDTYLALALATLLFTTVNLVFGFFARGK